MAAPDRRQLDDLPADELYPVVLIEDSGLGHPVVFVQRESMSRQLDIERHAVILDAAYERASMPNVQYAMLDFAGGGAHAPRRRRSEARHDRHGQKARSSYRPAAPAAVARV